MNDRRGKRPMTRRTKQEHRRMREELERQGVPEDTGPQAHEQVDRDTTSGAPAIVDTQPGVPVVKEPLDAIERDDPARSDDRP